MMICYQKDRFAGPMKVVKTFFVEFCDNSNIHGVRYFTERGLHWSERLWWLIAIAVSLWMYGSLTRNIWVDWNEKPVTLSFTERKESIAAIPFPQVTICPENIISIQKINNIEQQLNFKSKLSTIKKELFSKVLVHICPRLQQEQSELKENFTSDAIYTRILRLAQISSRYMITCKFSIQFNVSCDLVPVLTDEGICFTFNGLSPFALYTDEMARGMKILMNSVANKSDSNWSFETPFDYSWGIHMKPIHTPIPGRDSGLLFGLEIDIGHKVLQCNGFDRGFKVTVNLPGESIKISKNFIRIPPAEDTRIILKPKLIFTAVALRSYDPNQRQCYFNSERQLRFFKIYSQSSCEDECLANFTRIKCGCVKFNQPRDNKTRICGAANINCYKSAELKLLSGFVDSFRVKCNCLPSCTTLDYNIEIERSKFDSKSFNTSFRNSTRKSMEAGMLWMFYDDKYMTTVKRIPVYTYSDFLANCGGLLGLFLGASALSIIELVYFTTLRLFWAIRSSRSSSEIMTSMKRKLHELRLVRAVLWFFNELCDNSNIHGVLYFTRRKLHWSERLWWMVSMGISIWLCYLFVHNFWLQWNENAVTLSFSKSPEPISTIPLPTITICSGIKSLISKLNGTQLRSLIHLLRRPHGHNVNLDYHAVFQSNSMFALTTEPSFLYLPKNESIEIYAAIQRVSPQLNDTFENCWWRNELVACSTYFVPILTHEGLCFTFNALNSKEIYTNEMAPQLKIVATKPSAIDWRLERIHSNGENNPLRLLDSSEEASFKIIFSMHDDEIDIIYKLMYSDFKVIFTTPGDTIMYTSKFHRVPLSKDVRISINAKKTTTSGKLRSYTSDQRRCYFESERQLRFFKIYTQSNCEEECLANFSMRLIGCVKFSLPRNEHDSICGLGKLKNFRNSIDLFALDKRVLESDGHPVLAAIREKCNCLPTCTTIEYNALIDVTHLNKKSNDRNGRRVQQAKLTISFDNSVEIVERIETYTFAEFLAICGGLLGLFMGISTMSIIELIYLCTLRWFWKMRRERTDNAADILVTRTIEVMPYNDSNR